MLVKRLVIKSGFTFKGKTVNKRRINVAGKIKEDFKKVDIKNELMERGG